MKPAPMACHTEPAARLDGAAILLALLLLGFLSSNGLVQGRIAEAEAAVRDAAVR